MSDNSTRPTQLEEAGSPAIVSDGTIHTGVPNTAPQDGQKELRTRLHQEGPSAGLGGAVPTTKTDTLISFHDEACELVERTPGYKDLLEHARQLERALQRRDALLREMTNNWPGEFYGDLFERIQKELEWPTSTPSSAG